MQHPAAQGVERLDQPCAGHQGNGANCGADRQGLGGSAWRRRERPGRPGWNAHQLARARQENDGEKEWPAPKAADGPEELAHAQQAGQSNDDLGQAGRGAAPLRQEPTADPPPDHPERGRHGGKHGHCEEVTGNGHASTVGQAGGAGHPR